MLRFASAALALTLIAGGASAATLCKPAATPVSEDSVREMLTGKGYKDLKFGKDDGCMEAKGHNAAGKRVEIYIDPANGQIVKVKGE
ncbi:PepSY domain-containing protein [Elstera cyanobacteriorum]|uniref:PepSY domain-containing protein n=1 Tax=Elstera cyanobacteriorum TaxID=2022747 RepID=A0A255XW23_9PROT|nr:PepSY domain-containing protein [Elstera cyanobacteriorum]MCK6444024.1 PepSY domain-containing protein [Elstera cyanobacteriorum]OYQ21133.1 hypothetical protein CHR90_02775 [Elstera cyanobacteriorum]GGA01981.1 hypothetical protein GCM10011497_35900 [Elstera cyanobacteriorum]